MSMRYYGVDLADCESIPWEETCRLCNELAAAHSPILVTWVLSTAMHFESMHDTILVKKHDAKHDWPLT